MLSIKNYITDHSSHYFLQRKMIIHLSDKDTVLWGPERVHTILQAILKTEEKADQDQEHFWVFQLDARHKVKQLDLISLGIVNQALVHPREVFTRAVQNRCSYIIVAHNHPSGVVEFSGDDIDITRRLIAAGELLGIEVLDHIVTSAEGYCSFKQEGLM